MFSIDLDVYAALLFRIRVFVVSHPLHPEPWELAFLLARRRGKVLFIRVPLLTPHLTVSVSFCRQRSQRIKYAKIGI